MKSTLSQRLRAARGAIFPEISQRQIASEMSVSPSAVNLWEAGKTEPNATHLARLATRYKVSTDWLLGVEPSPKTTTLNQRPSTYLNTVPVVAASALCRWSWEDTGEVLQTLNHYPPHTAASIVVTSDAMNTVCPTGSYAVVSKGHPLAPGQIVLATVGNSTEPVVRKYVREGGTDMLVADDVRFPSFHLDDGVSIIGCVTEVVHRKLLV